MALLDPTCLYYTLSWLYLILLNCTKALIGSNWVYYTLPRLYLTLHDSTIYCTSALLSSTGTLLDSITPYHCSTWLYFTVRDSTKLYHALCLALLDSYSTPLHCLPVTQLGSPWSVLDSTTLYHAAAWLYLILLYSTTLYRGSTWPHLTLLHPTMALLSSTCILLNLPWLYLADSTWLYYTLPCLYLTLLDSTHTLPRHYLALLDSTRLYYSSTTLLGSTTLYFGCTTSTRLYYTLPLHPLGSTWLYLTTLHFTLLHSTPCICLDLLDSLLYSTKLYLSCLALLGSTWPHLSLLHSTMSSTWLYLILLNSIIALLRVANVKNQPPNFEQLIPCAWRAHRCLNNRTLKLLLQAYIARELHRNCFMWLRG